jgi:hypothetical protein
MSVDPYAMLDVTYRVAAFVLDGHGEDVIGGVLSLGDSVEYVALVSPMQQTSETAFVAIGRLVTAYDAENVPLEDEDV